MSALGIFVLVSLWITFGGGLEVIILSLFGIQRPTNQSYFQMPVSSAPVTKTNTSHPPSPSVIQRYTTPAPTYSPEPPVFKGYTNTSSPEPPVFKGYTNTREQDIGEQTKELIRRNMRENEEKQRQRDSQREVQPPRPARNYAIINGQLIEPSTNYAEINGETDLHYPKPAPSPTVIQHYANPAPTYSPEPPVFKGYTNTNEVYLPNPPPAQEEIQPPRPTRNYAIINGQLIEPSTNYAEINGEPVFIPTK